MKKFLKSKKGIAISIGLLVVIGILVFKNGSNGRLETVSPIVDDLVRATKISGKVIASEDASLGFETAGTISSIQKRVGDSVEKGTPLIRLDNTAVTSDLEKARAELASAQAELAKLDGSGQYETSISNAKRSLVQAIIDVYTAADDAVYNKTDQLFLEPYSSRPQIAAIFSGSNDLRDSINSQRVEIGVMLDSWKTSISRLSLNTYSNTDLETAKNNLNKISLYLIDLSRAVNTFEASAALSQDTIDGYKVDVLAARDNVGSAGQSLITDEGSYRSLLSDVPVQVARVEAARATLLSCQNKLAKSVLVSPIRGIVSRVDAKVGEVAAIGAPIVYIIGPNYIVETFVPEVSIAGIRVGNIAVISLDAYPNTTFDATVNHIDPAETIRDGVSTYKIELTFNTSDERIRSGMTANTEIETLRKPGVLLLPERAIAREEGETVVFVLVGSGMERRVIEIGERDSSGSVEILSGLSESESVVLDPSPFI